MKLNTFYFSCGPSLVFDILTTEDYYHFKNLKFATQII